MNKKLLFSLFSTIFFFLSVAPVHAQSSKPHGLIVEPAMTEVELSKTDEEKTIIIQYENTTDDQLLLEMIPVDFKQSDPRGGIHLLNKDEGSFSYSLSSFLSFKTEQLLVAPHQKLPFQVTVKNRQDLSPGGHYGAVIARVKDDSVNEETDQKVTHVAPSLSALIVVRKTGGERYHLALNSLDWPSRIVHVGIPQNITATFQNEGNIHIIPYGEVLVRDIFGRQIAKGVINSGSVAVFPETRRYIKVDIHKISRPLPISFHTVHVKGTDSLKKITYVFTDSYIYVYPPFGIGVLLLVGIGVFIYMKRKTRLS